MEMLLIYYVIIMLIYFVTGRINNMESLITILIPIVVAVVGVVITSIKERKEIIGVKEYLKEDIKEYLKNDIKEYLKNDIRTYIEKDIKNILNSTNELAKHKIDPNVLKILDNAEFIKKDIENKNLLSEEYKSKINRNLMIANIESTYDKIVDLEIEVKEKTDKLVQEKDKINILIQENEQLISEINYLKNHIEEITKSNEEREKSLELKINELTKRNKKQDKGISR